MYLSNKIFTLIVAVISIQIIAQDFNKINLNTNLNPLEQSIYGWIQTQQLPNGLIKNTDNSNNSSLYNNALAAILFSSQHDFKKTEAIFNYFNKQLKKEFLKNKGKPAAIDKIFFKNKE